MAQENTDVLGELGFHFNNSICGLPALLREGKLDKAEADSAKQRFLEGLDLMLTQPHVLVSPFLPWVEQLRDVVEKSDLISREGQEPVYHMYRAIIGGAYSHAS